jgi:glycosyltransferase involved in cell wall biosynthesis
MATHQHRPLVSIGLPIYNEEEHLAQALDSLLGQDYDNIEVIISDNASTDATPRICAEYAGRDARVRYHRNETNIGGINNFNRVFELAQGEFFMWAAGHDVRHPTQVSRCLEVLSQDSSIVLCYSQVAWINDEGEQLEKIHEYIDTRGLPDKMVRLNVVLWSLQECFPIYGVFRSSALKQTAVYTNVVSPDMSLLIELAMVGKFAYIPEPVFKLRRARDHGDWQVYVTKHFQSGAIGKRPQRLYWRMMRELAARAARHFDSFPGRVLGRMFVVAAVLIKFRWMRVGLRSLNRKTAQPSPDAR